MRPYLFRYRRPVVNPRALGRLLAFFLTAGILTLLFAAAAQMRPILASLAETNVSNAVTAIVSEAVY